MLKRAGALILILFLLLPVSGCYDRQEPDELSYVSVIGLDKGVTDQLRLTFQIITFKQGGAGGGGGGGGASSTSLFSVDCPGFFTGLDQINIGTARQLNLMHAKLLVVSEELARSGLLKKYLGGFVRYREMRRIMHFAVSRGSAEDFVKEIKPVVGTNPAKGLQLSLGQWQYLGFYPRVRLLDFYENIKDPLRDPIAILAAVNKQNNLKKPGEGKPKKTLTGTEYLAGQVPRKGGTKREFFGAAVFRKTKMVGVLNGDEVRVWQMINGQFKRAYFTTKDPKTPGYIISLDVRPARKPKIRVDIGGSSPEVNVHLQLEGAILSIPSFRHYEDESLLPIIEKSFEKEIKAQSEKLIHKCQTKYRADIFGFGKKAALNFMTIEDLDKYKWQKKYPKAKVNVKVDFNIRRTGTMLRTSPIPEGDNQ